MSKQDRQAVRTAQDLERKYNLGQYAQGSSRNESEMIKISREVSECRNQLNSLQREVDEAFYDSTLKDTLIWDGNTNGLDVFDMMGDGTYTYYPVSGTVPVLSDLADGVTIEMISDAGVEKVTVNDFISYHDEMLISQSNSSVLFVLVDGADFYGSIIPKKGIYFMHNDIYGYVSKIAIPNYTGFNTVVPVLKNESLPEIGIEKINGLQIYSGTKTTNANGNISTGLSASEYLIIGASFQRSSGSSSMCTVYASEGTLGVHVTDTSGTLAGSVSGTLRYAYIAL